MSGLRLRTEFEEWAEREGYPVSRESDGETYRDPRVHCGWWAWQAAHGLPTGELICRRCGLRETARERLGLPEPDPTF